MGVKLGEGESRTATRVWRSQSTRGALRGARAKAKSAAEGRLSFLATEWGANANQLTEVELYEARSAVAKNKREN